MPLKNLLEHEKTTCLELLEKAGNADLWDALLEGQARLYFDFEIKWLAKEKWWQQAENVLEIGSGNGSYLHRLSCEFNEKIFQGIEKLPTSLNLAKERYTGTNLNFQEGDAEVFYPTKENSVDVVLFRLVLQHLTDSAVALNNAAKYFSSEGYVLIIDACDIATRSSHPITAIDEALRLVAEIQKNEGKGNRKVTLELLRTLKNGKSSLSQLYQVIFSNLDVDGNILDDIIHIKNEKDRKQYCNNGLLFITLLHRTYHVSIDLNKAYEELKDYYINENAWTSMGMHFLVLRKNHSKT